MLKYTANTLKNLETLLKESGYQVRKGKGNFNTGYCVLESKKVVVLNRYHSVEAQINATIELLNNIIIPEAELSDPVKRFYNKIKPHMKAEKEGVIVEENEEVNSQSSSEDFGVIETVSDEEE